MNVDNAIKMLDDFIMNSDESVVDKHKLMDCVSVLIQRNDPFRDYKIVYTDKTTLLLKHKTLCQ
jgi:hypothetical protein